MTIATVTAVAAPVIAITATASMQRHYRDREQLINQEKALINAAQARENLRMLREIRRRRGEQ